MNLNDIRPRMTGRPSMRAMPVMTASFIRAFTSASESFSS